MRILWLPHLDWDYVRFGQREFHLIEQIKDVHDVHVLTWAQVQPSPPSILRSLRPWTRREDGVTVHQAPRVPNLRRGHIARSGRGLWINEHLYRRAVRALVAREAVDLVICGIGHESIGLPPADLPVPLLFDYLDFDMDYCPEVEAAYLECADAVLCTTGVLLDRAERVNPYCYLLPNGADLDSLERADPARIRRAYGLEDATVVSLIGVHCSERLFFVDAAAAAARVIPNLVLLVVGRQNERVRRMVERGRQLGLRVVATGLIPRAEVADFFAASDVGLFPNDQTPYFDACCPLKVLEYTAARRPVVATDLAELRRWAFPNVHLAQPTPEGFAEALLRAVQVPHTYPDMTAFSWPALGQRLRTILDDVVARGKRSRGADAGLVVGAGPERRSVP